jgi:hypothetical protein
MKLFLKQLTIKLFHIGFILILNYITNSCIWNTCVTWQSIDYKLPEDDTIMSIHVEVW